MWKNMLQPDSRPQRSIWYKRVYIACWMTKNTDTHSEYVIFPAFPRQQWLCERASVFFIYIYQFHVLDVTTVFTSPRRSSYVPGWQHSNLEKIGPFHIILHSLLDAFSLKFLLRIFTKACRYMTVRFVLQSNKKNRHFSRSSGYIYGISPWYIFVTDRQWRTQEFFSGRVQQIQLRTEDRQNGDLGTVAPSSGVLEAAVIWHKKFNFM